MVTFDAIAPAPVKPLLRGWLHLLALFVAICAGVRLCLHAQAARHGAAAAVYAVALATLFGVSALYHLPHWEPTPRRWLRRLDHSAIFFMVAGTYTPVAVALPAAPRATLLAVAWSGAAAGVALSLLWPAAPKAVATAPYLALGWLIAWYFPLIDRTLGYAVPFWLAAGGAAYTVGALAYALRWPNPWPRVFGYHEIFHAFVVVGAACHFVAVVYALVHAG